jgi:hypothetical protein
VSAQAGLGDEILAFGCPIYDSMFTEDPMTEQAPTRHDLEANIVKRCWKDESFREEFTADPADTLVKYLQVPAVSLPKIVVHEEPAGSWHIVLPAKAASGQELSETDLEKIAGGVTPGFGVQVVSMAASSVTPAVMYDRRRKEGW